MRFFLAFSSFFRLLFGAKLHPRAADYLPDDVRGLLDEPDDEEDEDSDDGEAEQPEDDKPAPAAARKSSDSAQSHRDGALAMLALLQREGRLVDFLQESIDDYDDSDIGAAVRDIHRGCKKVLEEHLTLEAVMPGDEDEDVKVPRGFDPTEVRLIGDVSGDPPFDGTLRHHGWRATDVSLPTLSDGVDRRVLAPAEVEIGK